MNISRRNFIGLGSAAVFSGTNFLTPVSAAEQKMHSGFGALSAEVIDDPLFYLTGADFKKHVGKEFLLTCEAGGIAGVLSNVTQIKAIKSDNSAKETSPQQPVAETFTLSFRLPINDFRQATYRLWHPKLGEFDLFLVPEARSKFLLYAVVNRI